MTSPRCILTTASADEHQSIVGEDHFLTFYAKGSRCWIERGDRREELQGNPFVLLRQLLDEYRASPGGAIGAFSYDLKDWIESSESKAIDDLDLPQIAFQFFRRLEKRRMDEFQSSDWVGEPAEGRGRGFPSRGYRCEVNSSMSPRFGSLRSNFSREQYLQSVNEVIELIRAGDIYQANISQRFECDFDGDPLALFTRILDLGPAPMMAYLAFPEFTLISQSPERFLKRTGTAVETCPIKGTRPRGKNPAEDEKLKHELWTSEKDNAELAMIIDLMRNDLGKLAIPGSVKVADPKRIETYANVHHLVATVTAQVLPDVKSLDLIKACFPGGSITGCPKLRAMEIIEEIEPVKRSFYTGSIGYVRFNGDFDFNIAIRTLIATKRKLYFNLGGGIVVDSDPQKEYEETLHKGASLMKLFDV
ncbi:MAG: aminodeoxychorismate synthase component I [Deltaproteobacteria bacterium]|nr:aminodeoxychorismate synthase component I [Deltaproteobacteria bacterium]